MSLLTMQKIFDAKKLFKTDRPSCADSIRATSSYPLPITDTTKRVTHIVILTHSLNQPIN